MEFVIVHHMRYVSEQQFNLIREALWAQAWDGVTVKVFDKTFWLDAVKNGMQQHLKGLDAYPSCQVQAVCFEHDADEDDGDHIESTVMFARISPAMIEEVETLLANEVVPKGQRWDSVPSILMGAYTRQGAGVSRYTEPNEAPRPRAASTEESREYTSIQLNRVTELQVHTDRFNRDTNWVISFGKYTGGRVWIARKGGSEPPPGLPDSPLRGEYTRVLQHSQPVAALRPEARARGGTGAGLESELGVFHAKQTACFDIRALAAAEELWIPLQQTVPEPSMDGGHPPLPGGMVQRLGGHGGRWQTGCAGHCPAGLGEAPPTGTPDKVAGLPNLPTRVKDESGALTQGQVDETEWSVARGPCGH
eukprot:6202536-Amphidinium_carterae.1